MPAKPKRPAPTISKTLLEQRTRRQLLTAKRILRMEKQLASLYRKIERQATANDAARIHVAHAFGNSAGFRLVEDSVPTLEGRRPSIRGENEPGADNQAADDSRV
jgi:hypothetical protein